MVDSQMMINFPVLGKISVNNLDEDEIEEKLKHAYLKKPTLQVLQ